MVKTVILTKTELGFLLHLVLVYYGKQSKLKADMNNSFTSDGRESDKGFTYHI